MQNTNPSFHITESEAAWIESETVRQIIQRVKATQKQAFATIFLLLLLLYSHIPMTLWLIWFVLHILGFITRSLLFSNSKLNSVLVDTSQSEQEVYLRNIHLVPIIGCVWGSTVYLFNGREPSVIDAACFTMVLIYGVGSAINEPVIFSV